MAWTRRNLLLAGLAFGCTGGPVSRSEIAGGIASDLDVVVIGAGAAGLAATQTLSRLGKSVVLVEATDRVGGRAHTDTQTFGVPYDRGAHWLHYGDANPFKAYGEGLRDFRIYQSPDQIMVFDEGRRLCSGACDAFDDALTAAEEAIWDGRVLDQPASNVVDTTGFWGRTVAFSVGPWEMAKYLRNFSTRDWSCTTEGADNICAQGYGALLAHSAQGVPARLSTPVSEVRMTATGVEVVTPRGTLPARACIVTASNGVLASGGIAFTPRLPDAKYEAFERIPMGLYNRVALKFSTDIFQTGQEDWFAVERLGSDEGPDDFGITTNVSGTGLVYCDAGAGLARDLEAAGPRASVEHALARLRDMLGRQVVDQSYEGIADASAWGREPFTLGSYASADPGAFALRQVLREPVEDRIFFAGEACHVDQWATVAGAHLSGCQTAQNVALTLDGMQPLGLGSCEISEEDAEENPAAAEQDLRQDPGDCPVVQGMAA